MDRTYFTGVSRPLATSEPNLVLLIVDDDITFARRLGMAFRERGLAVEISTTIEEAEVAIRLRQFDIVITDLRIGTGSGLELVELTSEISPITKLLVLTGYGDVRAVVSAVKRGATEFLSKPADADEILEVLGIKIEGDRSADQFIKSADLVRWEHINTVFDQTGRNISATARLLQMHRRTLQRLLARGPPGS